MYTILDNIEIYEKPVPRTKKVPHCAAKLEASDDKSITGKFVLPGDLPIPSLGTKFFFNFHWVGDEDGEWRSPLLRQGWIPDSP